MTTKTIDTLLTDISTLILSGVDTPNPDVIEAFGKRVSSILSNRLTTRKPREFTLRMSNIGKSDVQLWYEAHGYKKDEELSSDTLLKFMFGDIIEELLLSLAELAGHSVTDRQKEISYKGIVGHIDACIDGEVVDVKSASSRSFDKFEDGSLKTDDPFGYYMQLSGYAKALGMERAHFLAMDKQMAKTCLHTVTSMDMPDVAARIDNIKDMLSKDTAPECVCTKKVETNGNEYLSAQCSYNPYKYFCHPNLRTFIYATGPRFFTKVVQTPRVVEVTGARDVG